MKTTNKIQIALILAATLIFGSCSENYLQTDPAGSTITESQYVNALNRLRGAMMGIYSLMYGFSDHDAFGIRSFDMYGDLLSGDMALTSKNYGWFYQDEQQETRAERSGYLWSLYYRMMYNINDYVHFVNTDYTVLDSVRVYGLPNHGLYVLNDQGDTTHLYTEADIEVMDYYAQALTMRAYVYTALTRFFCPSMNHVYKDGFFITNYPAFPLYNETNYQEVQPMAMLSDVYAQVETDLETAIDYFQAAEGHYTRENKLETDINVARGILAYSYINKARLAKDYDETMPLVAEPMTQALKYAEDAINSGAYRIIPNGRLCATGFNDVNEESWMWGENVSVETATGLGSFFGQVDIHSYSYAWAGDTKVIDKNLYDQIPSWDGRKYWFNDGSKNPSFTLCPDGKFFSAVSPTSTAADKIDREWLSDNVFMRIESIYLIAAEAAYYLQDLNKAVFYLDAILSQRLNLEDPNAATDYQNFKNEISTDRQKFFQELYRNWRLEMWGEGYGLQTFRRLSYNYYDETAPRDKDKVYRGANHMFNAGKSIEYTDEIIYTMTIPASELNYNPYMQDN